MRELLVEADTPLNNHFCQFFIEVVTWTHLGRRKTNWEKESPSGSQDSLAPTSPLPLHPVLPLIPLMFILPCINITVYKCCLLYKSWTWYSFLCRCAGHRWGYCDCGPRVSRASNGWSSRGTSWLGHTSSATQPAADCQTCTSQSLSRPSGRWEGC